MTGSIPNGGSISLGQVWSAAQWATAWQSKADFAFAFQLGNQLPISGGAMQIDNLLEVTPSGFNLVNEGSIWTNETYAFSGISKEFTAATPPIQGTSGPSATFFAFANNNGATNNVVALIADAVARTANGAVFGANFIARNAVVNGCKLVGLEIDVEPAPGTTISGASTGLVLNMFSIASPAAVCQVGGVSGTWGNGFLTSHITGAHYAVVVGDPTTATSFINASSGTFSAGAIILGTGIAQGIAFGTGGFGVSPIVFGDSSGNFEVDMGASGAMVFNSPTGAAAFTFNKFGNFNMPNNGTIQINSVQVLAQQIAGYGTPTGGSHQASFAAGAITLPNLAAAVAQLIIDLKTHGMIGT